MRIILVHGFNASPQMNFHPWLSAELTARGFEAVAPTLPLKVGEEFGTRTMLEEMKRQVGKIKNDDILLGHSLGGLVVLNFLEAAEMTETPRAAVLVASPWKVSRPELRHLFLDDLDADVAMWKAREFVVIHSRDDKLVPFDHARRLADSLKARLIETERDDHYLGEQYPILLQTIEEIAHSPFAYEPGAALADDYASSR